MAVSTSVDTAVMGAMIVNRVLAATTSTGKAKVATMTVGVMMVAKTTMDTAIVAMVIVTTVMAATTSLDTATVAEIMVGTATPATITATTINNTSWVETEGVHCSGRKWSSKYVMKLMRCTASFHTQILGMMSLQKISMARFLYGNLLYQCGSVLDLM